MTLTEHVTDLLYEAADAVVNPDGYADDLDESERRAAQRDRLEAALRAVVEAAQR